MQTSIQQSGILDLVLQSGLMVQFVLLMLVMTSVFSWAVIISKWRTFKSVFKNSSSFLELFWSGKSLDEIAEKTEGNASPVALVFKSGFKELKKLSGAEKTADGQLEVENIQRSLQRASQSEISRLEKNLGWLATIASAAPFIGLFGTVWGIMNSFHNIGTTGSANLAVVAPGISEALIATAVGLAAAIPAVIAYNHFINQIKRVVVDMDCFSQDFLNIIQRSFLAGKKK